MNQPNDWDDSIKAEHAKWLSLFGSQYEKNWQKLAANNNEAALAEARVRNLLQDHGVTVEPNEDLLGRKPRPDFACSVGTERFFVEVTCITTETAERYFDVKAVSSSVSSYNVFGLVDAIFRECRNKASQCGNTEFPTLIAIGTFHSDAAMACFDRAHLGMSLTGKTQLAWNVDVTTGTQSPTYSVTGLEAAAFFGLAQQGGIKPARSSISGVLVCALGLEPIRAIGLLHPDAVRPFDCALLPAVEFGRVQLHTNPERLSVSWG